MSCDSGLRLDSSLVQHDLLSPIDFHLVEPAEKNPRLFAIGDTPGDFRYNRLGAYVHWSLPRLYRTGTADADSRRDQKGYTPPAKDMEDPAAAIFKKVPNRWLLVRHLKSSTPSGTPIPDVRIFL